MYKPFFFVFCIIFSQISFAQNPNKNYNKFKQLKEETATSNSYRTAAGAPGHAYYQQQADYIIEIELNEITDRITGEETITYTNNSPDELTYLWVQLDQNVRAQNAMSKAASPSYVNQSYIKESLEYFYKQNLYDFDGGYNITNVSNADGSELSYTIHETMMRINLPTPLRSGQQFTFHIQWNYLVNDRMAIGGRSGYEEFEDGHKLYTIAQFFPRMAVYNDVVGWQNKQFLGNGEFALPFGNYDVKITVPADHVIGATGVLQNEKKVLCKTILDRLSKARNSFDKPVILVTENEAIENESNGASNAKKTWHFKAENVRDFAFATSRKFIWDAMAVKMSDGSTTMAMSLYPKEGNPLWEEYSTRAVAHTLNVYSRYTFDYPYPVAYSVHAASIGMEYPMICFNFGRPNEDGTYSDRTKYNMLGVIIHEVGHNYFPMIVNSDERQWGWMDEGINSFVEYLAEKEFDDEFDHWYGPPSKLMPYLRSGVENMTPIMSDADNIPSFELGNNAYGKPATALNILRNHVMGHELFDYAFKTYAERWKFKHPTPEDFFNTMEDASGVDLDWFWRGWFYTTDVVDVTIDSFYEISENLLEGKKAYQLKLKNDGGLPTPVIIEFQFTDGSKETQKYPAEVWKMGDSFSKVLLFDKEVKRLTFDPTEELADINPNNNSWPSNEKISTTKFDEFNKQ